MPEKKTSTLEATKKYHEAKARGRAAGRIGRPLSECPYSPRKESALVRIWVVGHREGRDERRAARERGDDVTSARRAKHAMG